jgi:hypothetical protein
MEVKKNTILVSRIEESDDIRELSEEKSETKIAKENTKEKETYLGQVEINEHFEDEPSVPEGGLKSLIDGFSKRKANIYEV